MTRRKKKRSRLPAGVTRREDGRYEIRVTWTDPLTRKRIDRMRTLPEGTTAGQAADEAAELLAQIKSGTKKQQAPSLKTCAQDWIARKAARDRAASTLESYTYSLGHCLALSNPDLSIDRYTRAHLLELRGKLERFPDRSASTLGGWWKDWCRMIADTCAERGLNDPTLRLESPALSSAPKRELRTLSRDQVHLVAQHVARTSNNPSYGALVAILAYTGCRRGEGFALTWGAVDLERRIITIARSAGWTKLGGWEVRSPKNGKVRKVGICDQLAEVLEKHAAWHRSRGVVPRGDVLVCVPASGDGVFLQPTALARRLKNAAKALELEQRVTAQVLRRTWNTLASEVMDRVLVQAMMGHLSDAMTSHYLGVRDESLVSNVVSMWELGVGEGANLPLKREEESS